MRAIAVFNTALDTHLGVRTLFDAPSVRSFGRKLSRRTGSEEEVPLATPASDL
jgi:hypothetical protein